MLNCLVNLKMFVSSSIYLSPKILITGCSSKISNDILKFEV